MGDASCKPKKFLSDSIPLDVGGVGKTGVLFPPGSGKDDVGPLQLFSGELGQLLVGLSVNVCEKPSTAVATFSSVGSYESSSLSLITTVETAGNCYPNVGTVESAASGRATG
ncbi:hypothetical protein TRVL_02775 [Trypanosoma vivax]|nr:hypothetical protein TRVL_02775 [Trypanosoma vivax]